MYFRPQQATNSKYTLSRFTKSHLQNLIRLDLYEPVRLARPKPTPWATITHAIAQVPDGSTVLVRPARYVGRVRLDRRFEHGSVVRSELPYQARLRYEGTVVRGFYGSGITLATEK